MHSRKQLAIVIDEIIASENNVSLEESIVNDYKKLNEKCDSIICKIRNRKKQKDQQKSGE